MKILPTIFCAFVFAFASSAYAQTTSDQQAQAAAQQQAAQQQLQRDQEKMGRDQQQLEQDQQALEHDQQGLGQDQQSRKLNQQQLEQQLEQARQEIQQAAQRMAQLSLQTQGPMISRVISMFDPNRAVLGVNLEDSKSARNAAGVSIGAVTPGGPAEKAGLRAGDVVTAINSVSFKSSSQGSAADQLVDFMDTVKPGDTLKLSYVRNGRNYSVDVKTGRLPDYSFAFGLSPLPPVSPVLSVPLIHQDNLRAIFGPGIWGPWGNMQLVQLTPALGQYFGTDKGLLVVRAPRDAALKLEDGDVILKIGDREPATPSQAMRILYSYSPGDAVTLHILRKGKPLALSITVPKTGGPRGQYQPMSLRDQAFIARWLDQGLG